MIAAIVISCALLRGWRGDAIGIPLIAIGSFAFLYLIQPMQLLWTGTYRLFLTDWQMSEGLLVPALMLLSFMWGWLYPSGAQRSMSTPWDRRAVWSWGFVAACTGLVLYAVFIERSGGFSASFSQAHGKAMAWEKNTAYLYCGPWLILSGSVMMLLGNPALRRRTWKRAAPYVFLSAFLVESILTASRASLFATAATYLVGSTIAGRKKITFLQAARLLLPACIGVLLMVGYRDVLHLGPRTSQELPSVESAYDETAGVSEYDLEHDTSGQEFLFHAVQLSTVDQTGKLDYGESWIEFLVINPIPRLLWPEKAYPPTGGVTLADIEEHTSLEIGPGSACGIVADLYARFHLFSALFFFALGFGLRRLFISARSLTSPITAVGYVMFYAVSLNMFAQGFGAIFVALGYSMVPVLLFSWRTSESRGNAKERQRKLILSQASALRRQTTALHREEWSSSRS